MTTTVISVKKEKKCEGKRTKRSSLLLLKKKHERKKRGKNEKKKKELDIITHLPARQLTHKSAFVEEIEDSTALFHWRIYIVLEF